LALKSQATAVPEGQTSPAYFFYGQEPFLAEAFVRDLQARLIPPDAPDFHLDVFHLDETSWAEILDAARTMPFFFSPWRILLVRLPEKRDDPDRGADKEANLVPAADAKLLKAYFAAPPSRTVMTIIFPGLIKKTSPVVRFFSSLRGVVTKEVKHMRGGDAIRWIESKARSLGKMMTPEGAKRLQEIVGSDLRLMDNEVEKLAIYVGEKKTIDIGDVNQASAWIRDFDMFELDNGLETGDFRACLLVLDNLFKSGEKPERILFRFVSHFRNILLARTLLHDRAADKKEIFRRIYPNISETFVDLYQNKFAALFSMVEGISRAEFSGLLKSLEIVDETIKSTDVPAKTAFEAFLFEYCRLKKKTKPTSRAWA
jgi:DNA polymerase III subunit delta